MFVSIKKTFKFDLECIKIKNVYMHIVFCLYCLLSLSIFQYKIFPY